VLEAVLPDFVSRGAGHLHIVSSATGFGGMPTASAYGASKAALINMAECLKIELERCGVGVSLSTPGFVKTPAQDDNAFPKPFMVTPEVAARRIADGVARGGFETTFPRRFTWLLKAIYALPKPLYLPLIRRQTGWAGPGEPPPPTLSGQPTLQRREGSR
jgi:short-subunit dehydrogenase